MRCLTWCFASIHSAPVLLLVVLVVEESLPKGLPISLSVSVSGVLRQGCVKETSVESSNSASTNP